MTELKTKPAIRFAGYTDAWEHRKMEEGISKIGDGIHGTPNYTKNGGFAFINGNNLVNGKIVINPDTKMVDITQLTNAEKDLDASTILMSINGTIGNLAWYHGEGIMLGKSAAYLKVSEFDKEFVYVLLQTRNVLAHFMNNLTGTTIKNLGLKTIRETPTFIPKNDEQKKIGNFFRNLDETITLKNQQHEKLVNIKKSMLEKMFPKKGANVPEIRFDGFVEPWVERKLGEMFDSSVSSNTLSRADLNYDGGEVKNIHYGDILMSFGECVDVSSDSIPYITNGGFIEYKNQMLRDGDIIFADAAEDEMVGKAIVITNSKATNIVSGLHTIVFRPKEKVSPCYFGYFVNANAYRHQLKPLMQGVKVLSLSRSKLANTSVIYPSLFDEQAKIGDFFSQLDVYIGHCQQELEKLQNIKKACLEKMFI